MQVVSVIIMDLIGFNAHALGRPPTPSHAPHAVVSVTNISVALLIKVLIASNELQCVFATEFGSLELSSSL